MGFWQTVAAGYKLMWNEAVFTVKNNSDKLFVGSGAGIMMIGAGLFARQAAKEETRQAISDAQKVIDECKMEMEKAENGTPEKKEAKKRYYKARAKKLGAIVKVYRKEIAVETVGVGLVVTGVVDANNKLNTAMAGTEAVSAEFMAYRANVIADQGPEADRKYLTTKTVPREREVSVRDTETGETETMVVTNGGFVIDADPSAFKLLFNENCPLWDTNFDLRIHKLNHALDEADIKMRSNGRLSVNDQRRLFGGLTPMKMDVGVGGIFGRIYDADDPEHPEYARPINWHYQEDEDFMTGRKDWVWIIFDVEKEPITKRIDQKLTEVET